MNLEYIIAQVEKIHQISGDDEVAHSKEDDLYKEFVTYIAENSSDIQLVAMAQEVLKTQDIDFARWCA